MRSFRPLGLALMLAMLLATSHGQPLLAADGALGAADRAVSAPAPAPEPEPAPVGQRVGESVSGALNTASTAVGNATGAPFGAQTAVPPHP